MVKEHPIDKLTEALDKLLGEAPPQDILILAMGFIAGANGYTPLSALFKSSGVLSSTDSLQEKAAKGDATAGFMSGLTSIPGLPIVGGIAGGLIAGLNGLFPTAPLSEPEKVTYDATMAKLSLACIGAIEAYAITRPGTVAGIGEIVKGIGEIVPG